MLVFFVSCSDNSIELTSTIQDGTASTRSLTPVSFDWENIDWMPTPLGQSQIPSPWVGAGSLVSTYGLEIINDRKASDGWELLYSTFNANASGPLSNPYFILYNKYRGNMRIFLYLTAQFVTTSSYIQDGLSISSSHQTSLLNFLGKAVVDATQNSSNYQEIQPKPLDGSAPLASNRWYMMEYELAYDPNLALIPYNEIQLYWNLNYQAITEFDFGGQIEGKLNAIMGSSSSNNPIVAASTKLGNTVGTGVVAGVGQLFLKNATINAETGANTLGLSNGLFKLITKGVDSAVSGAVGGLPGAAIGLISAIIGGGSSPKPVSYNLDAKITLKGTGTAVGSFPSTPISFWIPGTNISSNAIGYIPLYNKSLGVFNFNGRPTIKTEITQDTYGVEYNGQFEPCYYISEVKVKGGEDYKSYLIINPEVSKIADISIKKQELMMIWGEAIYANGGFIFEPTNYELNPTEFTEDSRYYNPYYFAVRFTIGVKPKDGSPESTIIKTFRLENIPSYTTDGREYIMGSGMTPCGG